MSLEHQRSKQPMRKLALRSSASERLRAWILTSRLYLIVFLLASTFMFGDKDCKTLAEEANQLIQKNSDVLSQRRVLDELVQKCPSIPEAYYNLGIIQYEAGDFSSAFQNFSKAYEIGKNERFATGLMLASIKTRNTGTFESVWKSSNKSSKKAVLERLQTKEEGEFVKSFLEPELGCEFARLALRFDLDDLLVSAAKDCREQPLSTLYTIIILRKHGRDFKETLQNISIIDLTVFDNIELLRLFELYVEAEDFNSAESLFKRIIKTESSVDLKCAGAYVYSRLNNLEQVQGLTQGIRCQSVTCFDMCARAAYFSGQLQLARTFLEEATEKYTNSSYFFNFLGVVHRSLGNRKEAENNFKRALELDPNNKDAQHNLGLK